jgi:hypothetical protein
MQLLWRHSIGMTPLSLLQTNKLLTLARLIVFNGFRAKAQ